MGKSIKLQGQYVLTGPVVIIIVNRPRWDNKKRFSPFTALADGMWEIVNRCGSTLFTFFIGLCED